MDFNHFNITSTTVETWNDKRFMILQSMLGKVGKTTFIEAPFSADYGCNVSIGEDCFINRIKLLLVYLLMTTISMSI